MMNVIVAKVMVMIKKVIVLKLCQNMVNVAVEIIMVKIIVK